MRRILWLLHVPELVRFLANRDLYHHTPRNTRLRPVEACGGRDRGRTIMNDGAPSIVFGPQALEFVAGTDSGF